MRVQDWQKWFSRNESFFHKELWKVLKSLRVKAGEKNPSKTAVKK